MSKAFIDEIFNCDESSFHSLCLKAFDYQSKENPIYSKYASHILKGNKPQNIYEIPFLPIELFKTNSIICKNEKAEKTFISSGTSGEKSKHLIADLSLYERSFLETFKKFYGEINDYCLIALLPSYQANKQSSLIYMIDRLLEINQHEKSGYYLQDYPKLSSTIEDLENKRQKTILFGVTYALIDFAKKFSKKLNYTTIIETGGMKGTRKELLKEEVHNILKNSFKLKNIHSEYGMTELLSQCYSNGNNIFQSPPWMKILIRDVNDPLSIIENNKRGGINIIDLANIYSCPFIATQDLGIAFENNCFSIIGRFSNSDIRGCNLLLG